jgi:hydrogenase/urease accessory protein HupE
VGGVSLPLGSLLRERGPTIATIIIVGVVVFAVIDAVMSLIGYSVASAVNATSAVSQAVASQAGVPVKQTAAYRVGNYTAVAAELDASGIGLPSLNRFTETALTFLGFVLRALGDKAIFVALVALGIAILVYEEVIEGE